MITRAQLAAVVTIAEALPGRDIVVIGASALRFYMEEFRGTDDIDLVVAVELDEFEGAIPLQRHKDKEHEFYAPGDVQLDVLPAGPKAIAEGLRWSNDHVMNMQGMDLAFAHAEPHVVHGVTIRVAPPTVIAILKMVAYCDRPADRRKDKEDIRYLLKNYLSEQSERWFVMEPAGWEWNWDACSAYWFGVDVGMIIKPRHHALIKAYLKRLQLDEDDLMWERWRAFQAGLAVART